MEESLDRYGLVGQFNFLVADGSFSSMKSVIKQLSNMEKAIADTSKSVDGSGLSGQFKSAARSLNTASGNMTKSLQPLKAEFRVLKAIAANIDFGGVTDDRQFKKATTTVNAYIKNLKELKNQVQGDTAAEREFTEVLKRQQRVMKDKLALHDAERKAAFFSQRKGEFGALQQVGGVVLNPLKQIGKEATQIYADFDDKMSAVAAISRSTGKDLDRLRAKAKYLGATTRFTAGQAADSEKFLAAAGFNAQQIFAGVPATLDLASAGQLGLAESADIASNVLSGMRMGVSDLGHITDVMALSAASANTNIQQLGVAMSYAAPNAALFGAGIEETSAMIGVMSNAGIQADKAGTAARGAFLKLAAPTLKGRMALNEYGISITDTSGKMRNIVDVMQDIGTSLQLDPAALASIVEAGDDVEKLGAIAQSKQISALKDIFGTTGISGASAAISQMQEFTRLSLAGKGSSFAVDDYEKLFKFQGIKKLDSDKDIFTSLLREVGSYQGALEKLDIATIQLVKSNEYLGNLSGSEMAKLSGYFQVPDGENLFDTILATAPNANTAVSKLTSAMGELGIEFKGKAGAAKTMAQVMENNLAGSFRSLGSAFEAVQVNLIEPIAPIIRGIADSLTKLLLIVANLPAPVRGLIAGAGVLTAGFAAVALVAGTVGVALFGFQQAAATATAAGIALQASVIPLTGFFPAAMGAFAGTASNPFETASFAAEAFSDTIASTSRDVNLGLSGMARNVALVSRSLVSMSVSFAVSPIGIVIASFLALNAILYQINPEINLLGTIFSAVSSVAGFAVGVIQGFGEALLQALDIPTSVAGSILTAPFTAVSSAIEYATVAFEAWRKSGRTIGTDIFKFVAQPFQLAGKAIENSWNFTLNYIKGLLTPFADFVARIGKLLQGGLAEASPGPTYMIREKWDYTIAFLEKLFIRIRNAAGLVNRAFLGIGDVTESSKVEAQQQMLQGTINLVTKSVKKLSVVGEAITKFREFEGSIIDGVKENFDFLSFTLLTLSSLPLTLLSQLEEGAALIVPELAFIIGEGIPRAFLYAMPGLVAIATSTGLIKGIEQGFMGAIDAMPEFLEKTSDKIYNSLSEGMKQQLNQGLSEGLTSFARSMPALFPGEMAINIDIDKSYLAIKDFIRGPLEGLVAYLHRVGDLSKEIGKEIYAGLEPIITFNPIPFLPPLIPLMTAILPMEKALATLGKSPSVQGIMEFLGGTILPVALRTIATISSLIIFAFNAIVTLPVVAVLQEVVSRLTPIAEILRAIALNIQAVGIAAGRSLLVAIDRAVVGIAALIMEIPYIGKHLSAAFLIATKALGSFFQLIAASAPRYLNLLLRFFPTKQLIALFSSYKKIFIDLMSGVVYAFREGLAPIANILMKALDPAAAFKFLAFYVRTKGLSGIIKSGGFGGLSQIFNLANYINPVDIALGLNKTLNEVARLVSGDGIPLDFISRKQSEIFQVLATPAARRLAEKEKRLVSLVEILEGASGPMKVFIKLVQGLMMVSPIVQIISRLALTMLFWYNILKPVNQQMIDAIANTRILGVSLMPLAKILEVTRFLVVDLGEALFRFLKMIPGMAATVIDIFDQLGTIIGVTIHEIVGVSSILANVFKFAVINPLAGILLAVTAVADGSLIAILEVFKLIRLKTQQYGDAIVALLHGNFMPLIKQVFIDLFGVINFGFQQTVMRAVGAIAYLAKTVGAIVGESVAEIVRLIRDPIGEITRLTEQSAKTLTAATAGVMVYVRLLQLDKLVRFAADFWPEILAVASVLARIYGLLSPIQFAIVGLIELGAFLSYEYATGFKNLDKIITALQHPINALNIAMQGIAGFLGLYISPDLTGFIGNLAEQFVKFLPVISSGVFVIALLLTRNIGGAFQMISSSVLLFIGRILQVSEAIAGVGDRVRQVASNANVQVGLSDVANRVRRRSTIAGIANPLAYSQDFKTQQQAAFLGDQRVGKSKATLRYQNELSKMEREMQRRSERGLISEVKRGTDFGKGLADPERRYYVKDKSGITEGVTGAAVEKRRNRFGIEQYKVTDIGRQLMKTSGEGGEKVKAGRGAEYENMRRDASKRSGLEAEFSRFGSAPSNEELVKLAGGKSTAIDLLSSFQKAMSNLHVEDIKADYLYVSKSKLPSVSKDKFDSERAFDIQLSRFKDKGNTDTSLNTSISAEKIRQSLLAVKKNPSSTAIKDTVTVLIENIKSTDRPDKVGVKMFGDSEINRYATELKEAKAAEKRVGGNQYNKVVGDIINEIMTVQSGFIAETISSFKEFESANRQAAKEMQESSGRSNQVATGFGDVAVQGVRNLGNSMRESSSLLEGQVASTRNSLVHTLFAWTGVPKILESMRFDKTIAIQARVIKARTDRLMQSEASAALVLKRARQRGLDALVSNSPIHADQNALLEKMRQPENKQLEQFFRQFMDTGKYQREATGHEITRLTQMVGASFGDRRPELKGENALQVLSDKLKSAPNLNKEDIQKLRRYLTHGAGDRGKQLKNADIEVLADQLKNAGIGGKDELEALQVMLQRDKNGLAQVFDQYLLTGRFVLKASQEQQEQIASLIGLSSSRELRNIDKIKLKNPLEQLKVNVQVFLESVDDGFERFNRTTIDRINSLESRLIKIPFLSVEMAERIVNPIRRFYSGIYRSALSAKNSSIKFAGDLFNAAESSIKQSNFSQRIQKLNKDFGIAQRNSLQYMTQEGREKAPKTHYQFMGQMFAELTKTDIKDRQVQDKILQSILKDQKDSEGNNISIKDRLVKLGMGDRIGRITEALGKALDVNEARARQIMENPDYTARAVAPYQVFLAREFPGLIKTFIGGVTALVAKTGAGGLIKKIVADISPALGKPVLIGISTIIDRARIAMSAGTNRIAREVEKVIGTNPFSNFLNNFSRFLARSGDSMSKFFTDRANGFDAERAKSWTAKIVDKAGELFRSVAGVLGQAGNQAQSQQGGILGAIGRLFSGVKNFFVGIFTNKDVERMKRERAVAETVAARLPGSNAQLRGRVRRAKVRVTELTEQIDAHSLGFKIKSLLKAASQKVGQGADALNARSRLTRTPSLHREASANSDHYQRQERIKAEKVIADLEKRRGNYQRLASSQGSTSLGDKARVQSSELASQIEQARRSIPDASQTFPAQEGMVGIAEYSRRILPLTNKISASILKGASSAARGISTYFQGAANRTETAWQEATNRIIGNNWWTMVKRAAWTGIKIVTSLNHGASDVTSAAWENTEHSTAANMRQMAQVATVTGTEIAHEMQHAAQVTQQSIAHIPQVAEQAAAKSTGFFHKLIGAMGGVGKAGMAVGGAVTAAGFAAQTAFFSLQNMGFIDEETAQSLYKVTELFTLVGAVGGLATSILTALGASFGAIASASGAAIAGVTGIGGAIAGTMGIAVIPLAPLILGIGAIGLAAGGLYLAFKNNFLGIGNLARSTGDMLSQTLSAPIAFVTAAWQRFIDAFGGKLMAIVQPALNVAQGLINALNHSPTEKIPTAWEGATTKIGESIQGMILPAKDAGQRMSELLNGEDAKKKRKTELVNSIAVTATGEKQSLTLQEKLHNAFNSLITSVSSLLSPLHSVNAKLDTQAKLLQIQIRQHQTAQAQSLWRFATNKGRNENLSKKLEGFIQKRFSRESAPEQLSHSARMMGGFVQPVMQRTTNPQMLANLQQSAIGKGASKIGNLIKPIFGMGALGEIGTLMLGIGGVTSALALLTFAFTTDFAEIRAKTLKLTTAITKMFSGSIATIHQAWAGFVHWFLDMPLVDTALGIALGLIDALNHSPTEKIPAAWDLAVEKISGSMNWLLTPAKEVAGILSAILSPVGNFFGGKVKQGSAVVNQGKEAVVKTKNSLTNTYAGMEGFFTQGSQAIESELHLHGEIFRSIASTLNHIASYTKSLLSLLDKPQEEVFSAVDRAPVLGKSSISLKPSRRQIGLAKKGQKWEARDTKKREEGIADDLGQQKRGWDIWGGIPLLNAIPVVKEIPGLGAIHIPDAVEIRNVFDKESAFRTKMQTQIQKEEVNAADAILQGLNSSSLSAQSKYAGLAEKVTVKKKGIGGLLGQTEDVYKINQAGQQYIEQQLASSAKNKVGIFSDSSLSATAASVGAKIPDKLLLDKALVGQGVLNDAIKVAPGQPGKSEQIVQLKSINSTLVEILTAISGLRPSLTELPVQQVVVEKQHQQSLPLESVKASPVQGVLNFLGKASSGIGEGIKSNIPKFQNSMSEIGQGIKENTPKAVNSIQGTVSQGAKWYADRQQQRITETKVPVVGNVSETIGQFVASLKTEHSKPVNYTAGIDRVKDFTQKGVATFNNNVSGISNGIKENMPLIADRVKSAKSRATEWFADRQQERTSNNAKDVKLLQTIGDRIGGFVSGVQAPSEAESATISRKQAFVNKKTYLAAKAGTGAFSEEKARIGQVSASQKPIIPGIPGIGDLGASNTSTAWAATTSAITENINSLVQPAEASGYELQKAVSEGSPGPTYWIRHYWEKTVGAIGGWMGDIQKDALQTGSILHGSLANSASEILLSPPKNDLKSQAIRSASYFMLAVGDRYQYLADRGVGSAAVLFAPGMEYFKSSLGQLGGDIVDFAGRSAKALLTLNFVELGDAVGDFFGNFKYGVGGVLSGFNSMSLSAIAFGLFSLSGISPLLLVLGGVAFTAAVIVANFLGIRTILSGLIKVGIGAGKILTGVLWGLVEAASAFKKIVRGILPALKGDFSLMQEGFRGLEVAFWKVKRSIYEGLKKIAQGSIQVLRGIGEAIEQVFRPLGFSLKWATESITNLFAAFGSGKQAGEKVASLLINAVKSVVNAVGFAINNVKKRFPEVKQFFVELVNRAVQSVKDGTSQIQEFIKNFTFKDAIASISQLFGSIDGSVESIPDRLKRLAPGITEALTAPLRYVGDFWRGFFNTILAELSPEIVTAIRKRFGDAISAVEPMFRQTLKMLNIEEYFDRAIVKIQSSWQQLGEWLGREDLLRVVGDRLQASLNPEKISQSFLSTVDFIERNWTKLANWIGTTGLFDWLFETLRKASLEFTLFMDFAKEGWIDFQKVLAKGEAFQGFFEGLKALGTKLSEWAASTSQAIYGVFPAAPILQIFGKIALLGERFSDTATFAQEKWNKLSIWLSQTPLIPGALDFLILLGSKFGEMIVGIQSQWPGFVDSLTSGEMFGDLPAKIKDFGQSIPELFENIRSGIDKVVPGVNNAIASIQIQWQRLTEFLNNKDLFSGILAGLQDFSSRIPQLFEEALRDIPAAFGKAADWIKGKWEKFAVEFQAILTPIVDFAKWLGQTLIDLLNHSPTVKIPEAWKAAVAKITDSLLALIAPAGWVASQIIEKFNLDVVKNSFNSLTGFISNFTSGLFSEVQQPLTDLIGVVVSASKTAIKFGQILFGIAKAVNNGAIASDEMTSKLTGVSSAVKHLGEFLGWVLQSLGQLSQGLGSASQDADRASSAGKTFGQVVGKVLAGIVSFSTTVLPPLFKVLWVFTQIGIELSAFALKFVWAFRFVLDWPGRVMIAVLGLYNAVLRFVAILSSISRKSKDAFAGMQDGFASFKTQLEGVALTASEIAGSFLGFAKDIGTFGSKMAGVVAEILVGLKDVGVALFKLGLDVSLPFDIFSVFKGIPDIITSISALGSNATELKGRLISELGELGAAIAQFLEQPLKSVGAIWEKTGGKIIGAIGGLRRKAKETGQELQGDLSEASPGPTYWIRKNWINTTETIQSRLSDLSLSAKIEGNSIYKFLDRSLTALSPAKIAEAEAALSGLKFDARLAVSTARSREKINPQTQLQKITTRQFRLNELYKQGTIDRNIYRQGLKNLESAQRRATLATEQDTAARRQAGESVRSLSLSLGSALSNIAPQLATPIFMVNDLVTSFLDIRATLPGIQTFYAANVATTVAADSAIATSALAKAGIVGSANGAIAASYGFVGGAARLAYTSMIVPLLPFLPLILGISAAVFLLYRAYQDNVGGIQDIIENAGSVLKDFGSGIFDAISGIASATLRVIAGILTPIISITKFIFTVFGGLFEALLKIGAAFAVFSFLYQIGVVFASVGAIIASFGAALTGAATIALSVAGVFTSVLVPAILSGIGAIFTAATTAIVPLLPFIPLILGIIAVGWALGKVFGFVGSIVGGVFQGIWDSTSEVFGVLFQEIGNIWNALVDLGSQIVQPFAQAFGAIASIFGNFDPSISGIASLIVNTLLIPIKILTFVLITAIKTISGLLIGVIKILSFIFKVAYKIIESVAIVAGTIAGIVAIIVVAANFGAAIAGVVGIVGAIGAIGAALSGVGTILLAIGSLITAFVVPAIMGGIGAVIAGISAAVIAAAPFLAIILGVVAIGWVLKETFVLVGSIITRVFQGIWSLIQWIVSNSLGILAKIPFIGGLLAPPAQGQPVPGYATGGLISGMGTSTGDRVPILASPGEYVINAAAARSNLPLLESINQGNGIEVSNLRALPVPAIPIPMSPVASSQAAEINVQFVFGDIVVQGASPSSAAEQFLSEFIKSLESPQAQRVIRTQLRDIVEKAKQ